MMPIYADPELRPFIVDEIQNEAAIRYLNKLAEEVKNRGLKSKGKMMTGLHVAPEIINFAKENRVDLIVMCTHTHSEIIPGVWRSVTHKVLARAGIPVLLLPLKR